jgi:hypothetical protein
MKGGIYVWVAEEYDEYQKDFTRLDPLAYKHLLHYEPNKKETHEGRDHLSRNGNPAIKYWEVDIDFCLRPSKVHGSCSIDKWSECLFPFDGESAPM